MHAKILDQHDEQIYAVIFDTGEDPIAGLTRFAEEQNLTASSFTAIGAFSEAVLAGDIAVEGRNRKKVHAHVVLGRRGGAACGGHLLEAKVRPTLEVILTETPGYLQRVYDPASGLALIRIDVP
jgi:predicted DNA-binding protein with PD1-like motif